MNDAAWQTLQNPFLSSDDRSLKDACLVHDGEAWTLATSAFSEERSTVAVYRSKTLADWRDPLHVWEGPEDGWLGLCSPDIMHDGQQWILSYNSWGDTQTERRNRFFYRTSRDLQNFFEPLPLAHDLLHGEAVIDAALAQHNGRWFLVCNRTARKETWIATADNITGPWRWVGDRPVQLGCAITEQENGLIHENYQLKNIDGRWFLITTDYRPHQPWLYALAGDADNPEEWSRWCDGRPLTIPGEKWNTVDVINAIALWDHRLVDGWIYAVYGGKSCQGQEMFTGSAGRKPWPRGWNSLGIARSRDMARWFLPGNASQ